MINYGKHNIVQTDIDAVVDVLENHFLTQGDKVPEFESALCAYTGAQYCTAVNSGTSGLHVACMALGIGKGDWVWTSPNSFVASANCALYCQASVDFVDIDPITRNMSVSHLANKLEQAKLTNTLPKAIVVVHFAGSSCDMLSIYKMCKALGIKIIEDAAHALGSEYEGKPVGSCRYSDMAVLSFHPVKSITTAEGGAITTNNPELAQRCVLFSKHGVTRNSELMQHANTIHNQGPWYYEQLVLGYNYRLSDLQAALGISQLSRIDAFMTTRRRLATRYLTKLKGLPIRLPSSVDVNESSWHLFMIEVPEHSRSEVFEALAESGIAANVHYIPIHLHPYYQTLGFKENDYPVAEAFYQNAITIPLFVGLSEAEQDHVITVLKQILQ